jgi:hypothetical protein
MATGTEGTTTPSTRTLLEDLPNHLIRPTTKGIMKGTYTNGKLELLGTRSVQWQEEGELDIQMRLDQLGELKWSIQNLQIIGNFDRLLQSIENGMAYSGTDGSYKDGHGTAAFRIQNDQGDKITGCNITAPGLQEHQSAYQSKLGGVLGILALLDLLQQHYALTIHQFIITCDCNSAGLKSLTYH